jgi:ATP-binding cassette subfamily B protein
VSSHRAEISVAARWRRLLGYLRPHRRVVTGIAALSLGVAALTALEPLVLKHLFDGLAASSGAKTVAATIGLLLGLAAIREVGAAAAHRLTGRTRLRVHFALTSEAVSRLHGPAGLHREERAGASLMRLDRGVQAMVSALSEIALSVLPALAWLGVAAAVMVRLEWRLALVVLAFSPLPAALASGAGAEQTRRERNLLERWTRIYSRFSAVLLDLVTVKTLAVEQTLGDVSEANEVVSDGIGHEVRVGSLQNLAVLLARGAALAGGAALVLHGALSLGSLVAFLGYVGGVFAPVQSLSHARTNFRLATSSMDHVFALIDTKELAHVHGDVEFRQVRFAYAAHGTPRIDGVQLEVRAGESVALVGPGGAGKSTLMALLQRLHDPSEGQVLVDGHDLRDVRHETLRRHVGIVGQHTLLFNDRRADGERSRLPAAERQRTAIAGALLKDPRILILEEPTAALDSESEALVQGALGTLMKGRTTFIIAHRLSTAMRVDRVVVLRQGRLVEQGTHAQLLERGGFYAALVARQTSGMFPARMPALHAVGG